MENYIFASVTRITDFHERRYRIEQQPRHLWETGDYVLGRVVGRATGCCPIETRSGRMIEVVQGDGIVGAFGRRSATLEIVGDWTTIQDDMRMEAMTGAGLFGRVSSRSSLIPPLVSLEYAGHVLVGGKKATMADYARSGSHAEFSIPVVMIIGTSMSAGKTACGKVIVRVLREMGLRVAAAKVTGAGRYRDILSMRDVGADAIFDFVDVGLPSTACPADVYRPALRDLLGLIQGSAADLVVIEAGASPLEPYNGDLAVEALNDHVFFTLLCASDPYSVLGVMSAFDTRPDLVSGIATSTEAGVALIEKLTGVHALNVLDRSARGELRALMKAKRHAVWDEDRSSR